MLPVLAPVDAITLVPAPFDVTELIMRVPDGVVLSVHVMPSGLVSIISPSGELMPPTTTNKEPVHVTPSNSGTVPGFLVVQLMPSGEVEIVPALTDVAPTTTN